MTDVMLERVLADVFAAGPRTAPRASVERAVETALREAQRPRRRSLLGADEWPPRRGSFGDPIVRRAVRLALLAGLVIALATATVLVGAHLLDPPVSPVIPPGPTDSVPSAPPATPHPLVEDLGELIDRDVGGFSAIRLLDGRVLLVGGADTTAGQVTINRAWIFDPRTNQLVETGAMTDRRYKPLLALLLDGRVVVVGGSVIDEATEPVGSAELFDPSTGTFTPTADQPITRQHCPCGAMDRAWAIPSIATLADGRVLLSGGQATTGGGRLAELYDPSTDLFRRIAIGCDATRGVQVSLRNGRVLVTCMPSRSDTFQPAAAVFDPALSVFTPVGAPTTVGADTATLLPDGRVLLTGSGADPNAEVYSPDTETFEAQPLSDLMDGALPGFDIGNGRVFYIGWGDPELGGPRFRILDVATMTLRDVLIPGLDFPDVAVRLADGRILLANAGAIRLLDPARLP